MDTEDPGVLIPLLLKQFYRLGWVSGTGGGISIRKGDRIFIAPSGVQKELVQVDAGAVIHTHSKWANLVTMLYKGPEFKITHQEMIKGIRDQATGKALLYTDMLTVPIIENTCFEEDLKDGMAQVMEKYPSTCAVLVRRHGVYVWGKSWKEAKTMCECYDYLFEMAAHMMQNGLDPTKP